MSRLGIGEIRDIFDNVGRFVRFLSVGDLFLLYFIYFLSLISVSYEAVLLLIC